MVLSFRKFVTWIFIPFYVYLLVAFFVVMSFIAFSHGYGEGKIRACGVMLQLAGVVLACVQLQELKKYFNLPGNLSIIRNWLRECPAIIRKKQIYNESCNDGVGILPSLQCEGSGLVDAQIEDRLWVLETEVANLRKLIVDFDDKHVSKYKKILNVLRIEKGKRRVDVSRLEEKIKICSIGSAYLTEFGLLYIFIGSIMSGFPGLFRVFY